MIIKYTVLTIVPRLKARPLPGQTKSTGIREVGCKACYIRYDGVLDKCGEHYNEHILWAEKAEYEDTEVVSNAASNVLPMEGSVAVRTLEGTEELLAVPV